MEYKKHSHKDVDQRSKKSGYAKGQPSGARGKPQHAKGDGVGARANREQSVKGQPRGVDSHNPAKKGKKAIPMKRSDK